MEQNGHFIVFQTPGYADETIFVPGLLRYRFAPGNGRDLLTHPQQPFVPGKHILVLSTFVPQHRNDSYSTHEYLVKSNLLMVMHLLNQHCVETGEKDLALHMTYDRLKPALDWVQLSYAMDTPVQYVADLCGFSTSYFMKLFKDLMGTGFTAYLNNYRLELAAYQLAVEDLNVIEVASNCGFHNHSYFTRAFVKKYGMTPVKYRKSCQHR